MKQILKRVNKIVSESILNSSEMFSDMKKNIFDTINHINQLSISILELAKTVKTHHEAINELYMIQDEIIHKIKNASVESNVVIKEKEKTPSKPN